MDKKTLFVLCIAFIPIIFPLYHADDFNDRPSSVRPLKNFTRTTCTRDADCNGHGRCSDSKRCVCEPGWIAFNTPNGKNRPCFYEQRSKTIAFICSLLVGTLGVDWFYLSRGATQYIIIGIIKLLLGCGCCSGAPLIKAAESSDSQGFKTISRVITGLLGFVSPVWWIVDWARILANKFPDGNGAPLKPW